MTTAIHILCKHKSSIIHIYIIAPEVSNFHRQNYKQPFQLCDHQNLQHYFNYHKSTKSISVHFRTLTLQNQPQYPIIISTTLSSSKSTKLF